MEKGIRPDDLPRWAPGELLLHNRDMNWDKIDIRRYHYGSLDVDLPPLEDHMIVIYDKGSTQMERRCGSRWSAQPVGPGAASLLSNRTGSIWRWRGEIEVTHVYISPKTVAQAAVEVFDRDIARVELHDVLTTEDALLRMLTSHLEAEASANALGGALYVEALRNQISVHVLRHYADVAFKESASHGTFLDREKRCLEEYISSRLEENIATEDLARLVNISIFHFGRKFRDTFGIPPHKYVTQKRLEHAKQSLLKDIPIKTVAIKCGFSDQSHMTRLFKRAYNTTPAEFRQEEFRFRR